VASKYDAAVAALYQAPFEAFVSERKRLAAELKSAGDAEGASRLGKTTRPPISAWVVNQLWWKERKAFQALFDTAERLRDIDPDPGETAAHRSAITTLRARAAKLLAEAGNSAAEATLRRVTSTLMALAAAGGFEPDAPGALRGDREPPGFDVAGLDASRPKKRQGDEPGARDDERASKREQAATARREKEQAALEQRRAERERAELRAERERLERKLRIAQGTYETRREEVARLKERLHEAETGVDEARSVVRELEKELAKS
jgi:hypothetical protein